MNNFLKLSVLVFTLAFASFSHAGDSVAVAYSSNMKLDQEINGMDSMVFKATKELHMNLDIELQYAHGRGEIDFLGGAANWSLDKAYSAFLKPNMHFNNFTLYGLAGMSKAQSDIIIYASNSKEKHHNSGVSTGFGVNYAITDSISVEAEHIEYFSNQTVSVAASNVGIRFAF